MIKTTSFSVPVTYLPKIREYSQKASILLGKRISMTEVVRLAIAGYLHAEYLYNDYLNAVRAEKEERYEKRIRKARMKACKAKRDLREKRRRERLPNDIIEDHRRYPNQHTQFDKIFDTFARMDKEMNVTHKVKDTFSEDIDR